MLHALDCLPAGTGKDFFPLGAWFGLAFVFGYFFVPWKPGRLLRGLQGGLALLFHWY